MDHCQSESTQFDESNKWAKQNPDMTFHNTDWFIVYIYESLYIMAYENYHVLVAG